MPVLDSLDGGRPWTRRQRTTARFSRLWGSPIISVTLTNGRQAGKMVYPLDEVLLLALLAVLAGAYLHRHRPLRREKAAPAAPLPPVQGRHAAARPGWRDLHSPGRRPVPALLRRLGGRGDRHSGRCHRIDGKTVRRSG